MCGWEPDGHPRPIGWAIAPPIVKQEDAMTDSAVKLGVIAEQTGPLSPMGIANANVAKMLVDDINERVVGQFQTDPLPMSGAACSVGKRSFRPQCFGA
jgi:hypothetical protein